MIKISLLSVICLIVWLLFTNPNNVIIGDSQAVSISYNSNKAMLEPSLKKNGWRVSDLIIALTTYEINSNIKHVFVSIGTNGGFSKDDSIEQLSNQLKIKFPNAKIYVIGGSYGWGYNIGICGCKSVTYYKRFEFLGIIKLKTDIGFSESHPTQCSPSIIKIGEEIDSIINNE